MTKTRFLMALIIALLAGGSWFLYLGARHDIQKLHLFTLESCKRLNILRVEDNISHLADFKVFRVVLVETEAQPVEKRFAAYRTVFLKQLSEAVNAKRWTPRTDCERAINARGLAFRPPAPVAFVTRLPPPDALTVYPSDFRPSK